MITELNNGVIVPMRGFGTAGLIEWQCNNNKVVDCVENALQCGYRHVDTASVYGNEISVGKGIGHSQIPREEIFISTKVAVGDMGYDETLSAFDKSISRLGLDYLDLFMIHWPQENKTRQTWKALETLYEQGLTRSIGVCNFERSDLNDLESWANIRPVCNQIEVQPFNNRIELRNYCFSKNIQVVSWSPLGAAQWRDIPDKDTPIKNVTIKGLAEKNSISHAQIILRWHYQHSLVAIPKSNNIKHIKQNFDIGGFKLSGMDMESIDRLNQNLSFAATPNH